MARRLARSLSIARVSHGSWRGVAAGTGTTHFPVPVEEAKSIASRVEELLLPGFVLRVRLDHGERLGQEEQRHDDALFVLTELASCRRQACE